MASEEKGLLAKALGRPLIGDGPPDLRPKPRISEQIIQGFLFACGAVSIVTTIGIILVLGGQSLGFFGDQFGETNKFVAEAIDPDETLLFVTEGGREVFEGDTIRVGLEKMRVTQVFDNVVTVDIIGTGAGFERFCAGESDISNASRAITAEEQATCEQNGINPIEFRVGTDAIAIVVNQANTFVEDVTLDELRAIFSTAETWADVRDGWPDEPILRAIPGTDSGTFDFFDDILFDGDPEPLLAPNPILSENDDTLAGVVRRNEFAVSFFGFAYFNSNRDALNAVSIEGVAPDIDSATEGTYALARPLFIYSDRTIMREKPQVAEFINFYLTNVTDVIEDVGYFPVDDEELAESRQEWLDAMDLEVLPPVDPELIEGNIITRGSSTVGPLTRRIAEEFAQQGYQPLIEVERGVDADPDDPATQATSHGNRAPIERQFRVSLVEFFTHTVWQPQNLDFGILPLVTATLMTSTIAMLVAIPLGLFSAIYLSEYASLRVRGILKPILEVLATIPTVVYGYFALTFVTPLLRQIFGSEVVQIYNTASAGIVVGILIIPYFGSLSEDALKAVPQRLREASYGLGATKLETVFKVVIPAALSGILAAFILSISRAIGETMIVAIAAGAGPKLTFNPFEGAETMTGHMARISGGDLSYDSIDYNSIFSIGLTLFVITLLLNIISRQIINRFREAY